LFLPPGSPGGPMSSQSGLERRSLRRRGADMMGYEELSGPSGGEGAAGSGGAVANGGSTGTRRRGAGASGVGYRTAGGSDIDAFSDRDLEGVLFKDKDAPTTRHSSKSYQGVKALKPEEAVEDINLIRSAIKRAR